MSGTLYRCRRHIGYSASKIARVYFVRLRLSTVICRITPYSIITVGHNNNIVYVIITCVRFRRVPYQHASSWRLGYNVSIHGSENHRKISTQYIQSPSVQTPRRHIVMITHTIHRFVPANRTIIRCFGFRLLSTVDYDIRSETRPATRLGDTRNTSITLCNNVHNTTTRDIKTEYARVSL